MSTVTPSGPSAPAALATGAGSAAPVAPPAAPAVAPAAPAAGAAPRGGADAYIGCVISLTSNSDIRYEGILYTVDTQQANIALKNGNFRLFCISGEICFFTLSCWWMR